jgi:hypothetical protein
MRQAGLVAFAAAMLAALPQGRSAAQVPPAGGGLQPNAEHVLGLEGISRGFKGVLSVQGDQMVFAWGRTKTSVPIASILDIYTTDDNLQVFRGTVGKTLKLGTPYGGGRLMSLFTQAAQVLTVEYKDENGGFHGAVFIFSKGKATEAKRQLVAAGAHASIPPEEPAKGKEEKKP